MPILLKIKKVIFTTLSKSLLKNLSIMISIILIVISSNNLFMCFIFGVLIGLLLAMSDKGDI